MGPRHASLGAAQTPQQSEQGARIAASYIVDERNTQLLVDEIEAQLLERVIFTSRQRFAHDCGLNLIEPSAIDCA